MEGGGDAGAAAAASAAATASQARARQEQLRSFAPDLSDASSSVAGGGGGVDSPMKNDSIGGGGGGGGNGFSGLGGGFGGGDNGPFSLPPVADPETAFATQLSQLEAMGFADRAAAIAALQATGGNVEAAVERLLR